MNHGDCPSISDNYSDHKRALIVSNLFSAGTAYGGVCKELSVHLSNRGWRITTTSMLQKRLLRPAAMCAEVWGARKQYSVAQIDVFSGPAFLWAEAVTGLLSHMRKPYILTLRGGNLPVFARRWPGRVRRLLASAAVVTTPSRYLQEHMAPFRTDIVLLSNALDLSDYHSRPPDQSVEPRLVWLRAFHRSYNPVLAAQVLQRLQEDWPDVHLTMIGPDKGDGTFPEFQRLVSQQHLEQHVSCVGGVPKAEVPYWLESGDIFINTTNIDNTPVSVIEAMASGLCIVSTNVGGLPYLLTHEHDALLVPPNDPDAMAAAVRRILNEPELAERLSRNARKRAEQFDWSVILPQWEALLLQVQTKR